MSRRRRGRSRPYSIVLTGSSTEVEQERDLTITGTIWIGPSASPRRRNMAVCPPIYMGATGEWSLPLGQQLPRRPSLDERHTRTLDQTSPELTVAISTKPGNTNDQSLTAEAPLASTKVKRKGKVGEDEVLKMACPGAERIRVEAAMYGVRPDCRSGNSLRRVRNICQGRSACSVPASNAVFGDPCVLTYKYLEVEYTCTEPGVTCPAWTRWLDRDDPISFYDWESFTSLRRVYPREICAEPSDIQARVRGSHVPAEQTGEQFFFYSPQLGLACRTRDQKDRRTCQDYEVRFCCPDDFAADGLCRVERVSSPKVVRGRNRQSPSAAKLA
ncbi:hypothetical protein Bbelb_214340 [Branchiostoma belcheri]|nr:hypothetical protein Bbelb_214340 [Branchiostoma belcheri]